MIGKYQVEKLYIKLDKKLTLKAAQIVIPKSKAKPSFEKIDKTFDNIKTLLTFFEYVECKKIDFDNNHFSVIFANDILYMTSDDYEIAGTMKREKNKLLAKISMLRIKRENIHMSGNLIYDIDTGVLKSNGRLNAYGIDGTFEAKKEDEVVDFNLSSSRFTSIDKLVDAFEIQEVLREWMVDKIAAKRYRIASLEGRIKLSEGNYSVVYDRLKAGLILEDVEIAYQKDLHRVVAKEARVRLREGTLSFDFTQPRYLDRDLKRSRVEITGLSGNSPMLKLDLNITTPVDNEVQKILRAYRLDIPISHQGSSAKMRLKMDIPLGEKEVDKNITTRLQANLDAGRLHYRDITLPVKSAQILYDSRKKVGLSVDGVFKKGIIRIGTTEIPVLGGKIAYEKETVNLKDVDIKDTWYKGKVSGKIESKKQKASLVFHAKKIALGQKEKIVVIKNKKLPLYLDYKKDMKIEIPSLATSIKKKKNRLHIKLKSLKKIKPFLRNMPLNIDDGHLDIWIDKNNIYTFKGNIERKECFLYGKKNRCFTKIPIRGKTEKGNLHFYALSKRVYFNMAKKRITLNNIHIDIEKFLQVKKKAKKSTSKPLVILGKASQIRYKKHLLITDSYDLEIKPNGEIKALASSEGDIVKLFIKKKNLRLKALRVKDKMLHPLIRFKGLKHGRYTVKLSGNMDKVMHGEIIVEGGVLSDFKAYNNTLAFINTLPALATFSNPGFSQKGFKMNEGVVEYRMIGEKILFDSIYIKGAAATIAGRGEIDLKKKSIYMDLAIQTARELGKAVGSLPLVGYILMGKDKSMTIGLKISGSLDKPVIQTSAAKEILTLPLQLIKRTLESPAHIFNH